MNNDRIFIKGREIISKTQHDSDLQNSQAVFFIDAENLSKTTFQVIYDKLWNDEPVHLILKSKYYDTLFTLASCGKSTTSNNMSLTFVSAPSGAASTGKYGVTLRAMRSYNIHITADEQGIVTQLGTSSGSYAFTLFNYDDVVNKAYVDNAIATAIGNVSSFSLLPVNALPTENIQTNVIYAVPSENPEEQNVRIEYVYVEGNWEKIGTTQIDLSNYYTKEEIDAKFEEIRNSMQTATSEDIQNIVSPQPEDEGGIDEGVELS